MTTSELVATKKSRVISWLQARPAGGQPGRVSGVLYAATQFVHAFGSFSLAGITTMSRSPHSFWQPHVFAFGPRKYAVCLPFFTGPV